MSPLNLFDKYFKITFWLIIIFETLSFLGHNFLLVNSILFFVIIIATLAISLWKIEYGFWIVTTELIIGSFGYLFSFDIIDYRLSLRLGIFIAVFIGWLYQAVKNKQVIFIKTNLWKPFLLFLTLLAIGIIIGIINNNGLSHIFFDVNAYLYFGLFFVAFHVINSWERINNFLQILLAAISTIAIKTFFLLFYFSHQTDDNLIRMMYTWVRDTRIGEISLITHNYYRIFSQSHIWSLFAFLLLLIVVILINKRDHLKKNLIVIWVGVILSSLTLLISFSRSFWLALGVVLILIFIYLNLKEKINWPRLSKIAVVMLIILLLELGFISLLVNIKLPSGGGPGGISIASLVVQRVSDTDEAATVSRYQLLKPLGNKILENPIFGSGFGTEVSFKSSDPRTMNINNGLYTTYSFEWGYLDILVKMGIIGLLAYLFVIYQIFKNGLRILSQTHEKLEYIFTLGLIFCLIGLIVTHSTTPYLNHPLGIFLIIIVSAIFFQFNTRHNNLKNLENT